MERDLVSITITTSPKTASLVLDGIKVSNPFVTTKKIDWDPHTLVVSADGYNPVSKTVNFEQDAEWNVVLAAIPLAVDANKKKPTRSLRRQRAASKEAVSTPVAAKADTSTKTTSKNDSATTPTPPKPGETLKTKKSITSRPIFRDNPYD